MTQLLLRVLMLVAIVLGAGIGVTAQEIGRADIELIPPNPTPQDVVSASLSGIWNNGCVPSNPQVDIMGNMIQVQTCNPGEFCTQAVTPWSSTVELGQLAAGIYNLAVTYDAGCNPAQRREIGRTSFTVSEGIGGTVSGVVPQQVLCWNRSTGQAVTITPEESATSWNCEAAGLQVNVGDEVFMAVESIRTD